MTGTTLYTSAKSFGVLKWGGWGLAMLIVLPAGFVASQWWWAPQNSQRSLIEAIEIEKEQSEETSFGNQLEKDFEHDVVWGESFGRVDADEALICSEYELDTTSVESKDCSYLDGETRGELLQPDLIVDDTKN